MMNSFLSLATVSIERGRKNEPHPQCRAKAVNQAVCVLRLLASLSWGSFMQQLDKSFEREHMMAPVFFS